MMRTAVLLLILLAAPAQGQDRTPDPPWMQDPSPQRPRVPDPPPAPQARTSSPFLLRLTVSPEGPVWVGQRIEVTLTAMTPVRFVTPPSWPDLIASQGRIIVLPEASTVPGTERVQGETYAALQRSYSVVAAEAGPVVISPVTMAVSVGGPGGQPVDAQATAPALRLDARAPPGVADVTRLVVSPAFRMTAATEGEARQVHVGQAVVRTLRMEADDTTSMLLPPGAWGSPEGVRVYPDPPVLQDRSDRGVFHAVRSERVAFVPQRSGPITLPGFSVAWFEPRSGRLREVKVDPLQLAVLPATGPDHAGVARQHRAAWLWATAAAASLVFGGAAWWWWRRKPHRHAADPLATLAAACRAGDARAALPALYRWCDAVLPSGGERTVAALARQAGVPALAEHAAALEKQALGDGTAGWDGAALLAAARSTERTLAHAVPATRRGALPALNPTGNTRMAARLAEPRWAR